MATKKVFIILSLVLFCSGLSYAAKKTPLMSEFAQEHYLKGVAAQEGNDFVEAEEWYQKALILEPNNLILQKYVLNNRAAMYAKQGNLEKAENSFKELLKIDPNYKLAELNLGLIYDQRRTRLEALEYWAKMFKLEDRKPKDFILEQGQDLEVSK